MGRSFEQMRNAAVFAVRMTDAYGESTAEWSLRGINAAVTSRAFEPCSQVS